MYTSQTQAGLSHNNNCRCVCLSRFEVERFCGVNPLSLPWVARLCQANSCNHNCLTGSQKDCRTRRSAPQYPPVCCARSSSSSAGGCGCQCLLWIERMERLAVRSGMGNSSSRSNLHRARRHNTKTASAAHVLASHALHSLLLHVGKGSARLANCAQRLNKPCVRKVMLLRQVCCVVMGGGQSFAFTLIPEKHGRGA
jgi:hypothetical protein